MGISMSNDFSKKMINTLIPKQLLDLNPIIAGGFPLSLFMTETLYKESPLMMSVAMENLDTSWAYSDIDLFFTKEDFEKTKAIFSIFEYMSDTSTASKHNIGISDPIPGHEKIIKITENISLYRNENIGQKKCSHGCRNARLRGFSFRTSSRSNKRCGGDRS
jgi:hypothetical protein